LAARLQRRNWPRQLRLEEPACKGRQDDRREPDHGGIDQQARTGGTPAWIYLVGAVAIGLALLFVILHLTGFSPAHH
jgi:hypothetical protein